MIPYWQKDQLRTELKGLKKRLDDLDKARKAAVISEVSEQAKQMIAENPDQKYIVHEFKAGSNAKVLLLILLIFSAPYNKSRHFAISVDPGKTQTLHKMSSSQGQGRQHSFMEIDHEIFSKVILSLLLIQERQLSVSGERMCTILVNGLED